MEQTKVSGVRQGWERSAGIEVCTSLTPRLIDGRPLGYRSYLAKLISFSLFLVVTLASVSSAQHLSVHVDSVEGFAGFSVPVRVLMENDDPVASIIVPLRYGSDKLFPDSVTFDGSIVSPDHQYLATYSYDSNLVRILVLPEIITPMPIMFDPGGLLATVWFSVSPFADEGFVSIDTAYTFDSLCFDDDRFYFYPEELQASDIHGNQLYPDFTPGGVAIMHLRPRE